MNFLQLLAGEPGLAQQAYEFGFAHLTLCKAAEADPPSTSFALSGRLYASKSGWVLLSVPNAVIRGLFDALDEPGVELPTKDGVLTGHISVARPEEISRTGGIDAWIERGKIFHYTLGKLKEVEPLGWPEMSRVWFVEVNSPELRTLRKSYGLPPLPMRGDRELPFHCTIAVRRRKVLQNNELSRTGNKDLLPLQAEKAARRVLQDEILAGWLAEALQGLSTSVDRRQQGRDSDKTAGCLSTQSQVARPQAMAPALAHDRASALAKDALAVQQSELPAIQELWGARDQSLRKMASEFPGVSSGHGSTTGGHDAGATAEERTLRALQLLLGDAEAATKESSQQSLDQVPRPAQNACGVGGNPRDSRLDAQSSDIPVWLDRSGGHDDASQASLKAAEALEFLFEPEPAVDPEFEKMAINGMGIPDRKNLGDLGQLSPGLVDWFVQRHEAQRAGPHYDVRFGTPASGLFSWATKKELPKPGERIALYQQPVHQHSYGNYQGPLTGYGAGYVKRHDKGQILITKVSPNAVHFTTAHREHPERFVLVKPPGWDKTWLLSNTTPAQPLPYQKVHFAKVPAEQVEQSLAQLQPGASVQAKIDGASSLIRLLHDGVELLSYRKSQETGRPIVHTERFFGGRPKQEIPPHLVGTILRGELYGRRLGEPEKAAAGHRAIPPHELGGLLNATIANSLAKQKSQGVELRNMIFDIQQLGKRPIDFNETPYEERRKLIEQVLPHLPDGGRFHLSPEVRTPEEAVQLWQQIRDKGHPLTEEGIVVHPRIGKPFKSKFTEDADVHVTGVFPGEGRLQGVGAGGLTYSLQPGGQTIGRVGSGIPDELRRELHENPHKYVGRVARIRAQQQLPSGAYRAPVFLAWHEDYPLASPEKHACGADCDCSCNQPSAAVCPQCGQPKPQEDDPEANDGYCPGCSQDLYKMALESQFLHALATTPPHFSPQQSLPENVLTHLQGVHSRGNELISQQEAAVRLGAPEDPAYTQGVAADRFLDALAGKPAVPLHPLDQAIRNVVG